MGKESSNNIQISDNHYKWWWLFLQYKRETLGDVSFER